MGLPSYTKSKQSIIEKQVVHWYTHNPQEYHVSMQDTLGIQCSVEFTIDSNIYSLLWPNGFQV
jgi:hypothetical protein